MATYTEPYRTGITECLLLIGNFYFVTLFRDGAFLCIFSSVNISCTLKMLILVVIMIVVDYW